MSVANVNVEEGTAEATISRTLPSSLNIPEINGEMVRLRPATMDDYALMDDLQAYYNASGITGKDAQAEKALVHTWVGRSVAWSKGLSPEESGVGDPESRRTIAWAVMADSDPDDDDPDDRSKVIGMIFLIDIDSWAKSARIQVMLGKDYRGRGYSRDAMPRVMTYGFAPEPAGLGLHRIWVAVPEKNTRSLSVYQSLGFTKEGVSRHALWDDANHRYQDQVVLGTLVDEYDPIRSLDAFGMHLIEDNPGVREALAAREHSLALEVNRGKGEPMSNHELDGELTEILAGEGDGNAAANSGDADKSQEQVSWPYSNRDEEGAERSKRAWWRNLGNNRTRGRADER
ncbi:GNAT family N-acetyltransferase [Bifidobacterium simiarum]|uniref:GNAT family N-acetyltransferase n=1 Tax=Bifidobacterium simiarum TaxID=2045441 RepID=A0A2M9HF57_9BIFI|nr:GNAT family protein [Bifidobacterium simiarum]MBT1165514.1 GNAT family N-acetyltransferase [Bifidobacterium simiarum]PJM75442.1 GNAT family N-acetyltransferase [Bifidobacterium simiarum]